jgi:hypothetical protein
VALLAAINAHGAVQDGATTFAETSRRQNSQTVSRGPFRCEGLGHVGGWRAIQWNRWVGRLQRVQVEEQRQVSGRRALQPALERRPGGGEFGICRCPYRAWRRPMPGISPLGLLSEPPLSEGTGWDGYDGGGLLGIGIEPIVGVAVRVDVARAIAPGADVAGATAASFEGAPGDDPPEPIDVPVVPGTRRSTLAMTFVSSAGALKSTVLVPSVSSAKLTGTLAPFQAEPPPGLDPVHVCQA